MKINPNIKNIYNGQSFKKWEPDLYNEIIQTWGSGWIQKLYNYEYHILEPPKCPICGKDLKFRKDIHRYNTYCSQACSRKDPIVNEKSKQTCIKHHGAVGFAAKDIRKKVEQTNIDRYGAENPFASEKIKEKIKQINLEKYGAENSAQNEEIKEKIKQTNLEKYGSPCPLQNDNIHKKTILTNVKKYGTKNYQSTQDYKDKVIQTSMDRYGVPNYAMTQECKDKVKKSNIELYGVPVSSQNEKVKERAKYTNMERYGVPYTSQSPMILEKIKQTHRNNSIAQIEDLLGYTSDGGWICKCPHSQCDKCKEKYYIIPGDHQPGSFYNTRKNRCIEPCTRLLPIQPTFSTYELQVRSWLDALNIEYICNDRSIINPLELDIYIPENHLAIEINGCYWHSNACKSKSYHMDKWSQCKEKGIKMITLWEDWIRDHPDSCKRLIMYHLGMIKDIEIPWDRNLVDLGLESESIKEHLSIHDGYECWDCGLFV